VKLAERIERLQKAFNQAFDVETTYRDSVPVIETFNEETVWEGVVDVFDVKAHAHAERAYGWVYNEGGEIEYATVLGVGPVDSPLKAVRAWLVSEGQKS
jgi:hypothetical protein